MPEWPIGAVSKIVVALWVTVGSNPTPSAPIPIVSEGSKKPDDFNLSGFSITGDRITSGRLNASPSHPQDKSHSQEPYTDNENDKRLPGERVEHWTHYPDAGVN